MQSASSFAESWYKITVSFIMLLMLGAWFGYLTVYGEFLAHKIWWQIWPANFWQIFSGQKSGSRSGYWHRLNHECSPENNQMTALYWVMPRVLIRRLTCEQLAIMLRWSPTDGAHATSRTQSWCASSFCSSTQPPPSSLHHTDQPTRTPPPSAAVVCQSHTGWVPSSGRFVCNQAI